MTNEQLGQLAREITERFLVDRWNIEQVHDNEREELVKRILAALEQVQREAERSEVGGRRAT